MATVDLYSLLPRVAPYLRMCPDTVAKQGLREAAHLFCRETEIWRVTLDAIHTSVGEDSYTLPPPTGAILLRVLKVEVDESVQNEDTYEVTPEGVLVFTTAPTTANLDIVCDIVALPGESLTEYPDWLVNRWNDALVAGAKGLLMLQAGVEDEPGKSRAE